MHLHSSEQSEHNHTHSHKKNLAMVLSLTFIYMVAEFVGGYLSNSLALVADAVHMLSDVGALLLSFFALWLYLRPASSKKTYGFYRTEIIAAFVNALALIVISFIIMYEAYLRFLHPSSVEAPLMIVIAIGGLVVNIIGAFLLHGASHENLNMKGAFLHIISDLLGSVGAIFAGVSILLWKFYLADPIISLVISLLILHSAINLIKEAVNVLLEASPSHINVESVKAEILAIQDVVDIHDLHVWSISSTNIALSAHVITNSKEYNKLLCKIHSLIDEKFGISHLTIQLEEPDFKECKCSF